VSVDRKEVVKFLVASGAKCNLKDIFGLTPIIIAQNLEHTDLLQIMCPSGVIPDQDRAEDNEFAI
jgi:ankyrin repeat protein